ncbi:MAG: ROK family protein [Propionibacteriales bacterium]|nr:ROK family protein [Propionibacteriales bacterium]
MSRQPGTPSLLRRLNDRAALELLLDSGPLTRTRVGELTGLSKVTASQLLTRLQDRGLVHVVGATEGGRGPNAELYAVVPGAGFGIGLHVEPDRVATAVVDLAGDVLADTTVDPRAAADPVAVVHAAVTDVLSRAKVPRSRVGAVVLGMPGLVDPASGDLRFAFDLPGWHEGVREALRKDLRSPVRIENDVNLAAVAEQTGGAAAGSDSFALMWVGRGLGLAVVLDGRLHRGTSGGAGEIGYLPVPGVPLPKGVERPRRTGFQALVGAEAVRSLARAHGVRTGSAAACVERATTRGSERDEEFLTELAGRLATGVASVCTIVDPGLVVLSGEIAEAGGSGLAARVDTALRSISPNATRVVVGEVGAQAVLRGALATARDMAREELFAG